VLESRAQNYEGVFKKSNYCLPREMKSTEQTPNVVIVDAINSLQASSNYLEMESEP